MPKSSIALDNVQKIADALEIETYKLFLEENSDEVNKNNNVCNYEEDYY